MQSKFLIQLTYTLASIYAALLLCLYIFFRDPVIALTYRVPMYNWGVLKQLIETDPAGLTQANFRAALWCVGAETSPQCNCMYNFHAGPNSTFARNAAKHTANGAPADKAMELADRQYQDLVSECLRQRTSWRKETCDYWCRVHIATPIGLACLFTSLFFSRITRFESRLLQMTAGFIPLVLGLVTIATHIGIDLAGGVVAALSVLSAITETSFYSCACAEEAQVYWNHLRFVAATFAVWAAVTQQARDLYLIGCYGTLGFALGMLAYTQYLMRYRQGCNARVRVVALYVWMGICVISACFLLLVQQHLYAGSPIWSSLAAVLALGVTSAQCLVNLPGMPVADDVQIGVTLLVLSCSTLAVSWDVLS